MSIKDQNYFSIGSNSTESADLAQLKIITTGSTVDWYPIEYAPVQQWQWPPTIITYPYPILDNDIKKQEKNMKKLYKIYMVSLDEQILLDGVLVVAIDQEDAKFSANVHDALKTANLKPADVTIICQEVGNVKVHEPVKKVQIVDDKK